MKNNYPEIVRFYNRSHIKLQRLIAAGKNLRKQNILRKRITRLLHQLTGTQLVRAGAVATVLASVFVLQSSEVNAQTFGPVQTNPFGLTNLSVLAGATGLDLVDLDSDGDFDIMVGEYFGDFIYIENVGSNTTPTFATTQTNPFGLYGSGAWSGPAFTDLDNDGDMDLMSAGIGASQYQAEFLFYENTGTNTTPVFAAFQSSPFGLSLLSSFVDPAFSDLDDDGDLDFMVTPYMSGYYYFENIGSNTAPVFSDAQINPFGLTTNFNAPLPIGFVDLDNDGDSDMLVGENYGSNFLYYENIGSMAAPQFANLQTNPFGLTAIDQHVGLAFIDIDGDGDMDLMSIDVNGNFHYFENTTPTGLNELSLSVSLYPTIVSDVVNIIVSNAELMTILVFDMQGRQVLSEQIEATKQTLDFTSVAPGSYVVHIVDQSDNTATQKVVKF